MTGSENKKAAELSLASLSVHADDNVSSHRAVAPAMHVSTTFRYSDNPDELVPMDNTDVRTPRLSFSPILPGPLAPRYRETQADDPSPPPPTTRTSTPASPTPISPVSRPS